MPIVVLIVFLIFWILWGVKIGLLAGLIVWAILVFGAR